MFSGITTFVDNSGFNLGTGSSIFTPATNTLTLGTNSNERVRINSSGNILTSGNTQLFGSNTSDGSDNKSIMINGGGAGSDTRGGYLIVHGNEHSSHPGITRLHAGNVGTANIEFYTAGSERLRIDSSGRLKVGNNVRPASDANEGAGLRVTSSLTRNQYYSPHGHYFGSIGYTDNTNTKAWLAVDSGYAQSSAVSAGIFLSAFHQDAGGSGCGLSLIHI